VPETILDIVPKDPQVEHVATQVEPPGMHEHGGEQRQKIGAGIGEETAGHERPLLDERVAAREFHEEKERIQDDQGIGDNRNRSASAIVIPNWQHVILSASLALLARTCALIRAGRVTPPTGPPRAVKSTQISLSSAQPIRAYTTMAMTDEAQTRSCPPTAFPGSGEGPQEQVGEPI
jgi:hypothetical protein